MKRRNSRPLHECRQRQLLAAYRQHRTRLKRRIDRLAILHCATSFDLLEAHRRPIPALSQALLKLAGQSATTRQELDRVSAATADSLSVTVRLIAAMTGTSTSPTAILTAAGVQAAAAPTSTTASQAEAVEALRQEIADLRREMVAGISTTASNTGALVRRFDDVTAQSGGDAVSVVQAA